MVLAYATLDDQSVQQAMNNGGLATLSLLPSGLVILPDGHSEPAAPPTSAACSSSAVVTHRSNTGSFVSFMYQTMLSGQPSEKPSLEAIDNVGNLICRVFRKIKDVVGANNIVNA
jgi:homeobox-leucine zipper protein